MSYNPTFTNIDISSGKDDAVPYLIATENKFQKQFKWCRENIEMNHLYDNIRKSVFECWKFGGICSSRTCKKHLQITK